MSKPAYKCAVESVAFRGESLPEVLRDVADFLETNPDFGIGHVDIGPIDVKYHEEDEVFAVQFTGDVIS